MQQQSSFQNFRTAAEFEASLNRTKGTKRRAKDGARYGTKDGANTQQRVVVIDNGSPAFVVYLVPGRTERFWREVQRRPEKRSGPGKAYVFVVNNDAYVRELDAHDHEYADGIPVEELLKTDAFLPWRVFSYRNAFVGYDDQDLANGRGSGNTVLLETSTPQTRGTKRTSEYVLISMGAHAFRSLAVGGGGVHTYVSEVELNNEVAYPYALDDQYVYFLSKFPVIAVPLNTPLLPDVLRADPNGWLYDASNLEGLPSLLDRWTGRTEDRRRFSGVIQIETRQLHPRPV